MRIAIKMDKKLPPPRKFEDDLSNSNNPILRMSWENIFKKKFGVDCEIEWKDEMNVQKSFGTDITIKTNKGRRYSIELKTRNKGCYNNPNYIMEIISHIYNKEKKPRTHLYSKEGWIYTTTAEYIFHGTLDEIGCNLIEVIFYSLVPFKTEKYKSEFTNLHPLWLSTLFSNGTFQLTLNKLIPVDVIKKDALEFWEWREEK